MTKKKSKRDKEQYPDLNEKMNLKLRRFYTDNRYYVNGVKFKGQKVIPELEAEDKQFLNQFNKEYYNASFDKKDEDKRLHISQIDNDTVQDIKGQIRAVKALRKKIFDKSPNTTTEKDREAAGQFTAQIEDMEAFLNEVYPKRDCEHLNNQRNRCFLNRNRASNQVALVSWEELDPDSVWIEFDEIGEFVDEEE